MPRNARWIYDERALYHLVAPKHTYYDCLKIVAKTVANHSHQNKERNIEIFNDQYLYYHKDQYQSYTLSPVVTTRHTNLMLERSMFPKKFLEIPSVSQSKNVML